MCQFQSGKEFSVDYDQSAIEQGDESRWDSAVRWRGGAALLRLDSQPVFAILLLACFSPSAPIIIHYASCNIRRGHTVACF